MKKFLLLFILIISVGCKSNKKDKLICNYEENNRKDIITIYFENNESVNYVKESNIILENSKEASKYKLDNNYDKIEVVDNRVSMYVSENLDNMTKKEIKSLYEKYGYTCNKKNHLSD